MLEYQQGAWKSPGRGLACGDADTGPAKEVGHLDPRETASPADPALRVRRHPERGYYDRRTINAILDAGLICHVGVVRNDGPLVLPTLYVRRDDTLYLHGAPAATLLNGLPGPLAITVTCLDGLVLARSLYHHSLNYRSVMVRGPGREVTDEAEKLAALEALAQRVQPGRWRDARAPSPAELRATRVVAVSTEAASAKVRTGPPVDEAEDAGLPVWAGVVPVRQVTEAPVPAPDLDPAIPLPAYLVTARVL
jgi:nitroimidazol reductase NimA-like FMN-containing flavoprotein (pyridoxamine 5'-phosphate oxidase superfamily)